MSGLFIGYLMADGDNIKGKKVLLAFSGGTDSCYSAVKLQRQGYMVEALVLDMTGDTGFITDAVSKAESIGIPCHVLDVKEEFRKSVVDYFTGEYLSGRTPAPCTVCNPAIKWKYLYEMAVREGFDHIATGHYFNISLSGGHYYVTKAADLSKDQSYYLCMLPQQMLEMALTPMGDEIKSRVVVSGQAPVQRESMGVCFLRGRDYREFIRERSGNHTSCTPGQITDGEGKIIGHHDGCAFYTIGQKKGLDLPTGMAVTGIEAVSNRLVAGTGNELFSGRLEVENYIISPPYLAKGTIPDLKIRGIGLNPQGGCTFTENDGRLLLELAEPAWAAAKGQPVVFYDGDRVIGGGFISEFG